MALTKIPGHLSSTPSISDSGSSTAITIDSSGNVSLAGNLSVTGSTTTADNLASADKNITLNYHASNDTSGSADGAGITIQDAVNSSTDATLLWDASSDIFKMSHGLQIPKNLHIKNTASEATALIFENTNNAQSLNIDYYNNAGSVQSRIGYDEGPAAWNFIPNTSNSNSALYINYSGNVGVGTTSLTSKFTVEGDIRQTTGDLLYTGGGNWDIKHTIDDQNILFYTSQSGSTTEKMRIKADGKVGIGTSSPTYGLQIDGADFSGNSLLITRGTSEFYVLNANNSYGVLGMNSNDDLQIRTNATTRMTIEAGGDIGIGTTSPSFASGGGLEIERAGIATLRFQNTSSGKSVEITQDSDFKIESMNGGADILLMPTANVGIGTTSPSRQLELFTAGAAGAYRFKIKGDTGYTGMEIENTASSNTNILFRNPSYTQELYMDTSGDFHVYRGGSLLTVKQNGLVGIGETSPDTILHIKQTNNSAGDLWTAVGAGNVPSLTVQNAGTTNNNNAAVYFKDNSGHRASVAARFVSHTSGDQKTQLRFSVTGSGTTREKMVLTEDGHLGINTMSPNAMLHVNRSVAGAGTDGISVGNSGVSAIGHTTGLRFQYNTAVPAAIRANLTNTSSGAGELGFYTSPDGTAGNLDKRLTILRTETSRAVTQSLGGHSVGDGNTGDVHKPGVRVLGWYNANASNSSYSYLHLVTSLWGGGSPHGNSEYIMGGFRITAHQYSTNASYGEAGVFFHNWNGSVGSGYSANYTGSYTNFCHVYVSSGGYVTLRLSAAAYKGYWIDLFQAGHYTTRDINVTAATFSSSATL